MTHYDITQLNRQLHNLYGDRFPALSPQMAQIWLDDLQAVDPEILDTAVLRWVRQHQTTHAPTLQNLLDMVQLVEEDQRALQAAWRPVENRDMAAILVDAAEQSVSITQRWAKAHVQLFLDGFCRPGNAHETAQRCREYADQYSEDRLSWSAEADWWDAGAPQSRRPLAMQAIDEQRDAHS